LEIRTLNLMKRSRKSKLYPTF